MGEAAFEGAPAARAHQAGIGMPDGQPRTNRTYVPTHISLNPRHQPAGSPLLDVAGPMRDKKTVVGHQQRLMIYSSFRIYIVANAQF